MLAGLLRQMPLDIKPDNLVALCAMIRVAKLIRMLAQDVIDPLASMARTLSDCRCTSPALPADGG